MNTDTKFGVTGLGCILLIIIANVIAGAWSVRYLAETFLHKFIPFGWALLVGLVGGELTIPAAIIVWILKHAGIL